MSSPKLIWLGLFLSALAVGAPAQTVTTIVPDGRPHRFEARDHQFFIDGQPTMLIAGEMHFGRVLPEDWELRIKQAKAMGLNTLSFYLFWNQVEPQEGQFSFQGMTDVRRVLQLCRDNGMWVVLRPGPYCCAEEEYGGIPYWTLKYPDVKVRADDPRYVEWSRRYIEQVYRQVADFQVDHGGPLLMVQVENEYGIVANGNVDYLRTLTKIFRDVGFTVPLFTCDPTTPVWKDAALRVPGLMYCRNGLKDDRGAAQSAAGIGDSPTYVPEVYTAWFSGWGEKIAHRYPTPAGIKWANYLLDHHDSFCLYLEFGGTNFGFSNGCNEFLPVQTSYDYEAPIDEAGRTTPKYRAFRALLSERLGIHPPEPPADPAVIALPTFTLTEKEPLLGMLPGQPTLVSAHPVAMEDLNQAYGFVDYRKEFATGLKGTLELHQAMDYAIVMVNGKTVGRAFRGYGPDSSKIALDVTGPATLDVLVYNLGRISVPVSAQTQWIAHKGLIGGASLDGTLLTDWKIYSLPFETIDHFQASAAPQTGPTFYRGTFQVGEPGGTFLDLRQWSMGVVWVNGHNLGRFWDRGGLRSLWVPGQWLKPGANEIYVLELHDAPKAAEVSGATDIIETPPVPFSVRLDSAAAPPPSAN